MALNPKFIGQRFLPIAATASSGNFPNAVHTIELYLDYVCPFSAKIFNTLESSVFPLIAHSPSLNSKVEFIFRQQIQPWHPSSTLTHEAAVAVQRVAPEKFWTFSKVLFSKQKDFFDVNVVNESRNATYKRLAAVAGEVGVSADEIYNLLAVSDKPGNEGSLNIGNKVTDDLKLLVKAARVSGVHVTPTVLFNGIEDRSISSSWTPQQWEEWLKKNIV